MSPDPNPAPGLDEEFGPVPVLLLPEGLEANAVLHGITKAVNGLRDLLVRKQDRFAEYAKEWEAKGDPLRQAQCRGQARAYRESATHLDAAQCGIQGDPPEDDETGEVEP